MTSLWPGQTRRHQILPRYFETALRYDHVPLGGVHALIEEGIISAVANWDPPGQAPGLLASVLSVPHHLIEFRQHIVHAARTRALLEQHRPDTAHWYLAHLAVAPTRQGAGLGSALLDERLSLCDERSEAAFLVCTRARTLDFYQSRGFQITAPITLPDRHGDTGPTVYGMVRQPQAK
ncbi:GNAT family N-acetyltransferase [Gordonia sp. OPL2]|uniref:GNAT family N-acetyltransferase n=1 Tax=Gordonia sp. OPL2 TaxID=2486274 RepID=UPI0034DAD76B